LPFDREAISRLGSARFARLGVMNAEGERGACAGLAQAGARERVPRAPAVTRLQFRNTSRVLALALGAAVLAAGARAEVVERIPAVVDGRPVLQSDVLLLAAVRGLAPDKALEAVIDERLMYAEASRAAQAAATAAEEEKAVARLYEERPELRGAVLDADLRRLVRRQLTIVKYVEFRFRPQVRVTPEELEQAYAAEHDGEEEAPPLAAVAPALEEKLARKALDERLETWVRDLRAGADVRYNR
jgi:hypothetical protein